MEAPQKDKAIANVVTAHNILVVTHMRALRRRCGRETPARLRVTAGPEDCCDILACMPDTVQPLRYYGSFVTRYIMTGW